LVLIVVPRYTASWDDVGMAEAVDAEEPARARPERRSRVKAPPAGHLPVTEVTFDRAGAASPFGDDQTFPLPVDELQYTHSTTP
jgi:hypothetical protein